MPEEPPKRRPSSLSGTFRKPFTEQVAFFRRKLGNLVPTARWDDIVGAAHDDAFMVAGAAKADLLADLAAAVDRAITEGKGIEAFRKDFRAIVERHGWHGWTGEDSAAGRAWRTRTIYRTNAATSYAAGRHAQLTAGNFAFWVYRHGGSQEPRLIHLTVFNGLYLPPDHPFWAKFYPPSDWGCSCYVVGARSERGARRLGGDPGKSLPKGWDKPDPKTGEPQGIGKHWGYAPGASVSPIVRAMAEKVRHWDHAIGKAFLDTIPDAQRDAFAKAYRGLPSVSDDARRYARRIIEPTEAVIQSSWTLGPVTRAQAETIASLKDDVDTSRFDFSLSVLGVRHAIDSHGNAKIEAARGQRMISHEDFGRLPLILLTAERIEDAGESDAREPLIRFVATIDGERYSAVFAIHRKRRTLSLKTLYVNPGRGAPPR